MNTDHPKPPRTRRRVLFVALTACALASAWRIHRTPSAYAGLYHQLLGAPAPARPAETSRAPRRLVAEARLVARPGAQVTVGAETPGRLLRLLVREKDTVAQGDLIAELDADEPRAAVAEARARLAEIDVDIPLYESRAARAAKLAPTGGVTVDEHEQRQRDLQAVHARRKVAAATLDRLQAALAKTQVRAPIAGTVTARHAHPGQTLATAAPIVTLVDLAQTHLEAEVNEFDAPIVSIGSPATVTAEGHPDQRWRATVTEIPDTITLRHLRPQDPGRPSDTGILLVKLTPQGPTPFKLNQRLEITIESPTTPVASVHD